MDQVTSLLIYDEHCGWSPSLNASARNGSGVAASRAVDTIKFVARGAIVDHTLDRDKLWAVQTPQTFNAELLRKAYAKTFAEYAGQRFQVSGAQRPAAGKRLHRAILVLAATADLGHAGSHTEHALGAGFT